MPTVWQSVLVPGARDRNAARQGGSQGVGETALDFEPHGHSVPPLPPGRVAGAYLDRTVAILEGLPVDELAAAAAHCAAARARGKQVDYMIQPLVELY
jgi:hypothetical protein